MARTPKSGGARWMERPAPLAWAAGVMVSASAALAQPGAVVPPPAPEREAPPAPRAALDEAGEARVRRALDSALERMASPRHETRAMAEDELRTLEGLRVSHVMERLRAGGLTPEQRVRLEAVGEAVFASEERAGLGVQFDQVAPQGAGIRIASTVEQFPASAVLKAGDVLLEADGVALRRFDDLRAAILAHRPGESMRIRLFRPDPGALAQAQREALEQAGQVGGLEAARRRAPWPEAGREMIVDAPLGRFGDLATPQPPAPSVLAQAWAVRQRLEGLSAATISVDEDAFSGAVADPAAWERSAGPGVAPGGEARQTVDRSPWSTTASARVIARPGAFQQFDPARDAVRDPDAFAQLEIITRHRQDLLTQAMRLDRVLDSPNTPPDQRQLAQSRRNALDAEIQMIDQMIEAMNNRPRR